MAHRVLTPSSPYTQPDYPLPLLTCPTKLPIPLPLQQQQHGKENTTTTNTSALSSPQLSPFVATPHPPMHHYHRPTASAEPTMTQLLASQPTPSSSSYANRFRDTDATMAQATGVVSWRKGQGFKQWEKVRLQSPEVRRKADVAQLCEFGFGPSASASGAARALRKVFAEKERRGRSSLTTNLISYQTFTTTTLTSSPTSLRAKRVSPLSNPPSPRVSSRRPKPKRNGSPTLVGSAFCSARDAQSSSWISFILLLRWDKAVMERCIWRGIRRRSRSWR